MLETIALHSLPMRGRKPKRPLRRLPNRLREWRERRGLTQQQVGQSVHMVAQNVGKLERGELELKVSQLADFARALGVAVPDLLPKDEADGVGGWSVPVLARAALRAGLGAVDADFAEPYDRIPLPRGLDGAEQCFAVEITDRSANALYAPGTVLICRELEPAARLRLGAKLVIRHFETDLAHDDTREVLVGTLDRTGQGHLNLDLHSTDRRAPASIRIRDQVSPALTAIAGGTALQTAQQFMQEIDYQPRPDDLALILGTVEMAIIPQ